MTAGGRAKGAARAASGLRRILALAVIALGFLHGPLMAQEQRQQAVTVGLYASPPFVMIDGGAYSGMAVELWQAIAAGLDMESRYETFPSYGALIEATRNGQIDVAVTNLTITRDRAEVMSFTQPWLDGGMRIMVSDTGSSGFWNIIGGLSDAGHLQTYALLFMVIIAGTVVLTLFDRHFDPEFPRRWPEGLAESLHHVVSVVRSGNTSHKNLFGWRGRVFSVIWTVFGVAVVAYVTSSVTSVMTTASLQRQINSLADLPGNTVGVLAGSVEQDYMAELGISARAYPGIEDAVEALRNEEIDAIVADAPVIEYHAHAHPEQRLAVVGKVFHPDKYGFAFPHDSDLVRPVTLQILHFQEDGTIAKLRSTHFGSAH